MTFEERVVQKDQVGIVFNVGLVEQVSEDCFSPEYWGSFAVPIEESGRGSAWFIDNGAPQWVLRQFRRGGYFARLIKKSYYFKSFDSSRSFREFRLLGRLLEAGLPVPRPVAACCRKTGVKLYQAQIIVERIPGAEMLSAPRFATEKDTWSRVGEVVRRFHDYGLFHADLNCKNILVTDGGIYLIDFDRCEIRTNATRAKRWKRENLKRLRRSLDKCFPESGFPAQEREAMWSAFMAGYCADLADV